MSVSEHTVETLVSMLHDAIQARNEAMRQLKEEKDLCEGKEYQIKELYKDLAQYTLTVQELKTKVARTPRNENADLLYAINTNPEKFMEAITYLRTADWKNKVAMVKEVRHIGYDGGLYPLKVAKDLVEAYLKVWDETPASTSTVHKDIMAKLSPNLPNKDPNPCVDMGCLYGL